MIANYFDGADNDHNHVDFMIANYFDGADNDHNHVDCIAGSENDDHPQSITYIIVD